MSDTEPECKRIKMEETIDNFIEKVVISKSNLQVVMGDEFNKVVPLVKVYVGQIKDIKDTSKIIRILNEILPLKNLQHLKRARKSEVLICPMSCLATKSIEDYIEQNITELKHAFESFKEIDVPSEPPKLKRQNIEYSKFWSCNFHPNIYLEKLFSGGFFTAEEVKTHRHYMGIAFETVKFYQNKLSKNINVSDILLNDINASVVVDPKNQSIVAIALDNRLKHPIQHSAMLAIDNVARTQNGGAWNTTTDNIPVNHRGIDETLLLYLKKKFPHIKFGASDYVTKEDLDEKSLVPSETPYLCTGYYVYMIREPCVMCAMGLVHARANRVFFSLKNENKGGLSSKCKLQCVSSLNHHFEVFTGFL